MANPSFYLGTQPIYGVGVHKSGDSGGGASVETCTVTISASQYSTEPATISYTQNGIIKTESVPLTEGGGIWKTYTVDKNTIVYLINLHLDAGGILYQQVIGGTLLSYSLEHAAWTCESINVEVTL